MTGVDLKYGTTKVLMPGEDVLMRLTMMLRQGLDELAVASKGLDRAQLHAKIALEPSPLDGRDRPLYHCRLSQRPTVGAAPHTTVLRQLVASIDGGHMDYTATAMIPPHVPATSARIASTITGAIASALAGGGPWSAGAALPAWEDEDREFKVDMRPARAWPYPNGYLQVVAAVTAPATPE